jgi:porphyrinogen peroxidase
LPSCPQGAGNPDPPERDTEVAIDSNGGSFAIAQRWVHDLSYFHGLPLNEQEATFGRTKEDNKRLDVQPPRSHLRHVELRAGKTGDDSTPKRDEMSRRSTPYAFHDGTVGLYFMGFAATQAPLIERMEAMYDTKGNARVTPSNAL